MKKGTKILVIIGLVIVLLLAVLVVNQLGLLDTRFWTYDKNVYSEFYDGVYVAGKDLDPGSYTVEIKGGSLHTGTVEIGESIDDYSGRAIWVSDGDRGFQFTIEEGQVLRSNIGSQREMRIKRVN